MSYKIGSFNLHKFAGDENKRDINTVSKIIRDEQFDIVALQEVTNEKAIVPILNRLMGWDWEYYKSPDENDCHGLAFLWNTRRLKPVSLEKNYEIILKSLCSMVSRCTCKIFTHSDKSPVKPFCELRLINVHLRFGEDNTMDKLKRRSYFSILKDIYDYFSNYRYGKNRPAYTIILGDYNLKYNDICFYLDEGVKNYPSNIYKNDQYIVVEQKEATTIKLDYSGFASDYDHFAYDENRFYGYALDTG